jgi:hypothetical protein
MYGQLALAVAALIAPTTGTPNPALSLLGRHLATYDRPRVNVWLNQQDPYRTGEPARVFSRPTSTPTSPFFEWIPMARSACCSRSSRGGQLRARGRTFEVLGRSQDEAFRVDDPAGVGYVFAVTGPIPSTTMKSPGVITGTTAPSPMAVRGDPYVALTDLAGALRGPDYDYDIAEYYVEQHYDYPRFVCYDCHSYVSYNNWDPYDSFCSRFRIVVYDDPYYYPYRYYGGRVAVVHPYRPEPRYVFKDYNPSDDYITRVATRPRGEPSRPGDADRSSADVGGPGRVPARSLPARVMADRPDAGDRDGRPTRDRTGIESPRRVSPTINRPGRRLPTSRDVGHRPHRPPRRRADASPSETRTARCARPMQPLKTSHRGCTSSRDAEPRRAAPAPSTAVEKPRTKDAKPRQEAPRTEPQKQPARNGDKDKDAARSKPTPPKSTGEPELRRRKPS